MFIYIVVGTWMESRHCKFGHETGVVILISIAISAAIWAVDHEKSQLEFSDIILFDVGLPLILYNAGFNMRRRRFFDNLSNLTMFGILSTFTCWVILSVFNIVANNQGWFTKEQFNDATQDW
jgi:NhaP-type Na+/H+ or K+/H+ antiporter